MKRERLLKSISKSGEAKFQAIVSSQKVDLDVGQGKNNPKLTLILYPNGLFTNEGKSTSLQAKITTPDKCPPLHPSLLVQVSITVFNASKSEVWNKATRQETINMHSFYMHNLLSCERLRDTDEEFLLLDISVQIQKAKEYY